MIVMPTRVVTCCVDFNVVMSSTLDLNCDITKDVNTRFYSYEVVCMPIKRSVGENQRDSLACSFRTFRQR